ncbi:plasmid replication initiator TrfA [Pseudomonas sp.]|uniref:plasmid replication initiator TrfA n=1 Tax=Pseudomonas sp. TaxID=306 RepID=UPI0028999D99|nr:plasmid replication initiator TrfA [Pseudomonas sp.]
MTEEGKKRGRGLANIKARAEAVEAQKSLQLPLWAEPLRSAPNEILRTALFTARNKKHPRVYISNQILSYGQTAVFYKGEELRQDDLDVWLQILHMSRGKELGKPIEFTFSEIKKALGWGYGKYYTQRLIEILDRLSATTVRIESTRLKSGKGMSLVRSFIYQTPDNEVSDVWSVEIEPEMGVLFGIDGAYSTRLEWQQRLNLGPLAKWLHGFYNSHRDPYPLHFEMLLEVSGSSAAQKSKAKQMVKDALEELVEVGFLKEMKIDAKGMVTVVKAKGAATV